MNSRYSPPYKTMSLLGRSGRRTLASIYQKQHHPISSPAVIQRQRQQQRRHASRTAVQIPSSRATPSFPTIESCPNPTCQCRETPPGLDIEREQPLDGTMAAYAEQVLISTGKSDWPSKIEDETDAVFLQQMKKFLGRGGKYSDVSLGFHYA